ncbi:MAG: recombinase family protein [Vicinamibacterales bacterium]|nr:recombinase family protein [Vicinamibacterales bacterium]
MQMAAIYARVSSEQQREAHTIASQTAALIEWARTLDVEVPKAWIFEDDGYSGATLERPGLERVRDLAAEGQIQTVLVYSPDRLSRKYAYQILLIEELARQGVETRFLKAPQSATAEDQLLVQFQGMIAEYERAQILERSRRGKRHRARAGEISVLSGAPYGYRYIRKSDEAPAAYAVIEAEARVVRDVYERYTVAGVSIGTITRGLNDQGVATRKAGARWERSMVWAMLRNPAYRGTACFGKTRVAPRQRVTRALRMRGGMTTRNSANHERPREEWIEIPVPALITEETFARAQELLHENKVRARRRTIEPSVVQGLVSCRKCGYALSRTSTRSSARSIHYYRCIGSDGWRHLGGPVCKNRPVRQDLLDQIVWTEVMRLLEDPALIEQELDRRLAAARAADPTKHREQTMQRELLRVGKGIERLLTAYQEELVSLEQLRERMPPLRQREQTLRTELHALVEQTRDRATYLRLAETLSAFLARLRLAADTLDVLERQRIVRLVVKEVLVGDDTIVLRHAIPVPSGPPGGSSPPPLGGSDDPGADRSYLLRTGRDLAAALQHLPACPRPGVGRPVCASRHAGPLCRRLRGDVRHGGAGRGSAMSGERGAHAARARVASGEDEEGRPFAGARRLRLSWLSPAEAHERSHLEAVAATRLLPATRTVVARHDAASSRSTWRHHDHKRPRATHHARGPRVPQPPPGGPDTGALKTRAGDLPSAPGAEPPGDLVHTVLLRTHGKPHVDSG